MRDARSSSGVAGGKVCPAAVSRYPRRKAAHPGAPGPRARLEHGQVLAAARRRSVRPRRRCAVT